MLFPLAKAAFLTALRWLAVWAVAVSIILAISTVSAASDGEEPWHVLANRIQFYHASQVVIGEGQCEVWRGDLRIRADSIRYSLKEKKVWAYGSVVISMAGDTLTGSEGEMDLVSRTGVVKDAHLFLARNNVHLVARSLEKSGPEEYRAQDAIISTCPLPRQAWSFKAKTLELEVTGMAVAKGVTFRVRELPVLYSPWVAVPINRSRRSGFLLPHFATSSRNGVEFVFPFFWAIGDSMDMTLYGHPMSERGWMQGMEFRYALSEKDKGIFRYNVLVDQLDDDDFNNDGDVRSNEKRWWLRAKADQELPLGLEAKLDLDLVSDRDYLLEFDSGPMSHHRTNQIFRKEFHRSLADDTDLIRPSTFQVTRAWEDAFMGSSIRYNDNQVPGEQDKTVQTAPFLGLQGFQKRLGRGPFFYDFNTSYVNYVREEGIKEQRFHLEPGIHLPYSIGRWADLKLEGRIEESLYLTSGSGEEGGVDNSDSRFSYLLGADLTTTLARKFRFKGGTYKNYIRPRIRYEYRPFVSQGDLPDIDFLDRLPPLNRVTFSLLSFVTSRKGLGGGRAAYSDLFRIKIEESFDVREEMRDDTPDHPRRPFSDLYLEIEFHPTPLSVLRYDTTLNFYGRGVTTYNLLGRLATEKGSSVDVDYRYNKETDVNEINLRAALKLSRQWEGTFSINRSLEQDTTFESQYGLRYQSGCWAVRGEYVEDQDESSFMLHLELLGIGGWQQLN